MTGTAEALERRIDELRAAVRHALVAGDRPRANALRAELRDAERAWEAAVARLAAGPAPGAPARRATPLREQLHQALTLLSVPASPRLLVEVHDALLPGELAGARLTHLRRDEERSFRVAPYSRPYYLCPALTADLLAPARGLLAVSTWPLERRVVGPLSHRVNVLVAAVRIAERVAREPGPGERLLARLAATIPGAADPADGAAPPGSVAEAARAELKLHEDADRSHREAAAARARARLDDAELLFGTRIRLVAAAGTDPFPAPRNPR